MNKRYFLRGLGFGLIIGAIVMMVALKTDNKSNNDTATVSDAAKTTEITTTEATSTETETTQATTTETPTVEEETTEAVTTENVTTEAPTTEAVTTEAPTTEEVTTEEPSTETQKGGSITIKSGMYAMAISEALYDIGMVESADDFYNYLLSTGNATKLMCGTFTFTGDETYDEIIEILKSRD